MQNLKEAIPKGCQTSKSHKKSKNKTKIYMTLP